MSITSISLLAEQFNNHIRPCIISSLHPEELGYVDLWDHNVLKEADRQVAEVAADVITTSGKKYLLEVMWDMADPQHPINWVLTQS